MSECAVPTHVTLNVDRPRDIFIFIYRTEMMQFICCFLCICHTLLGKVCSYLLSSYKVACSKVNLKDKHLFLQISALALIA